MVGTTFPGRPASRGGIVVRIERRASGGGVGTVGELKEKERRKVSFRGGDGGERGEEREGEGRCRGKRDELESVVRYRSTRREGR